MNPFLTITPPSQNGSSRLVARAEFSDDDAAAVAKKFNCWLAQKMMNAFRKGCWLVVFSLALSACGGQLYKVATPAKGTPPALPAVQDEIAVSAKALTGDESLAQFDANLLLAGVVAVDVRLANRTAAAIPLSSLRWELHDSSKTVFKPLTPKKALKRVMGFYGNRLFGQVAYQQTSENYERLGLPLATALEPQQELRGFLFFESKYEATGLSGLSLAISGHGAPLQVTLN